MDNKAKHRRVDESREKTRRKHSRKMWGTLGALLVTGIVVPVMSGAATPLGHALWARARAALSGARPQHGQPLITTVSAVARDETQGSGEGERAAAPGGLAVTAVHVVSDPCEGAPGWRVPLPAGRLGRSPSPGAATYQWAHGHGGQEVSGTHVDLTLQDTAAAPVTVTGISVETTGRVTPVNGSFVVPFGQCGGGEETAHFLVAKLDDFPPQVYAGRLLITRDGHLAVHQAAGRPFDSGSFRVSRGRPATFRLFAYSHRAGYSWRIAVTWLMAGGREHLTRITDIGGHPFVTVPRPASVPVTSEPKGGLLGNPPVWARSGEAWDG